MGDAGPPTPPPGMMGDAAWSSETPPLREIKVLVTGFGPFKSFLVNPSWLIASALSHELYPTTSHSSPDPAYKITLIVHSSAMRVSYSSVSEMMPSLISQHDPDFILHIGVAGGRDCYSLETRAHRDGYRIKDVDDKDGFARGESMWKKEGVPDVLFVGWDEADVLKRWEAGVQTGLSEHGFLGPANADSRTNTNTSSSIWGSSETAANVAAAVQAARAEENRKKSAVKLSRDAGRFLCEYLLFESLSLRWIDAHRHMHPYLHLLHPHPHGEQHPEPSGQVGGYSVQHHNEIGTSWRPQHEGQGEQQAAGQSSSSISGSSSAHGHHGHQDQNGSSEAERGQGQEAKDLEEQHKKQRLAHDRLGKVAFLHVPGWTSVEDINRGKLVAEEAIRALVASWEEGFRRPLGWGGPDARAFTTQHSEDHGQSQGHTQGSVGSAASAVSAILAAGPIGSNIVWRA
ncbi:hypothetical protein HRR83_004253 [Exophiala dermatitidis]|uniref:Pyroglutamyl-peptidase n=1 Tax=Exophiala dermatitidis TaxID=5970 RepID=A0AAN6ET10_EXODE|nr:hypothetical protein HRR73_006284 [Exophiala dermatitidis]KAJ4517778.1 hypothetical protein HRR75_002997 [Exophiala dermatitidis]KAJ4521441.1 hypothetical protein HRR74_003265 [Exophiala dermatitidis]KAJ4542115.1 hypothetical protein HRR77_006000 [Exophiala dermatitidis]KAJ4544880.1 hypothetical protein HRR76_002917 [Exophiala dermatitidis]